MDYGFVTETLKRTIEAAEKRREGFQSRGLDTAETDRIIMDACKQLAENVDNFHDESPLRDRIAALETENAGLRKEVATQKATIAQLQAMSAQRHVTEGSPTDDPEEGWGEWSDG